MSFSHQKKRSSANQDKFGFQVLEPRRLLAGDPFFGSPQLVTDGFRLEVETFDLGGEGVGYSDFDTTNNGGEFRPNEGVDIRVANDSGGGFAVGWLKNNEWLDFSVDIEGGNYDIGARLATGNGDPRDIRLSIGDGTNFSELGIFATETTGNWSNYETFVIPGVTIPGGNGQVLRAEFLGGGGFNFNWFDFQANPVGTVATQAIQNGDWLDAATWDAGVPDDTLRAIIPQGITVDIAGTDHVAKEVVVQGVLNVEESAGTTKTLTSDWVHVNSGGLFQIGSESDRYDENDFVLTLTGTDPLADHVIELANGTDIVVNNNNGFLMAAGAGRFQFFGQEKLSFTKLSATAEVGANQIQVANLIERNFDGVTSAASDGQVDWEVGDQIVIASSSFDYSHEDVRTITAISSAGDSSTLTLDQPLTYRHYGEIESYAQNFAAGTQAPTQQSEIDLRAEVALLSRNVVIKGLDSQDTDVAFGDRALLETFNDGDRDRTLNGIGGHIMVMNGAGQTTVSDVQLDKLGQAGRLGRYPFHWHFAGDRQGDLLRDVSITNSNNRAVVVHGADNARIEGVVAHDIHGHGFFLESAVENGNEFIANAAFGIHKVGTSSDRTDPFIVDFHDRVGVNGNLFNASSSFWITNPDNVFIGNISAGAEGSGYWFGPTNTPVNVPGAAALAADPYLQMMFDRDTLDATIDTFAHNVSHSTGVSIVVGAITNIPDDRSLEIFGGTQATFGEVSEISHFTTYKSQTGFYSTPKTTNVSFSNFRAADNGISYWDTTPGELKDSLFVGESRGNAEFADRSTSAFFLYFQALDLENVHFAGYGYDQFNKTDIYKIGGSHNRFDFFASGISFEDTTTADNLRTRTGGGSDPGLVRPTYDIDGSFTGHLGGGAGYSWVNYDEFWFDGNDGDLSLAATPNNFSVAITQKRFGGFRLTNRGLEDTTDNVRLRVTSFTGDEYVFGGTDEDHGGTGNDPLSRNPRFATVIGKEYKIEAERPFDLDTQRFRFAFHGWGYEENTVSNVFQVVGAGDLMKPTYYQTDTVLPRTNSLESLRDATESSYFRDANGDLWMKLFNNTQDTLGIRTQEVFGMVPVTAEPLEIASPVVVGDGTDARSIVDRLVVSFNDAVTLETGAFLVRDKVTLQEVTVTASIDNSSGSSVVTLMLSGALTESATGSLIDGNYELVIDGSKVFGSEGQQLDGDGDGSAGGDFVFGDEATDNFFRLFGDSTGDRQVNIFDLLHFRQSYRKSIGDVGFNSQFDSNGDGVVNIFDLLRFRNNYRKTI